MNNANGSVVPRAAATILLAYQRDESSAPQFLMGCRNSRHRFMPGVFVFPGGRVDRDEKSVDGTLINVLDNPRLDQLPDALERFYAAALRECLEETGIDIGVPPTTIIGRAITPRESPIRYDTLFFLVEVNDRLAIGDTTDELEDIGWYDHDQLKGKSVMRVTNMMIERAEALLAGQTPNFAYFTRV